MSTTFETLGLSPSLVAGLAKQEITRPTDIQREAIPILLSNRDVIGQAFTGSGKTLAYLCPLFEKIDSEKRQIQALILAPTHELVMQIYHQVQNLAQGSALPITSANIMGEANINHQIEKLKEKPHIIVGTPGRVLDLIKKKKINAQTIKTIIIDEVDNLLDNTNRQGVLDIIKSTQQDRQLSAFSASSSENTLAILHKEMKEPVLVTVMNQAKMNPNIDHFYVVGEQREKFELLRKLLNAAQPERALVFLNDGERIDLLADKLNYHGYETFGLHGALSKEERKKALDNFRKGIIRILVSSDLSARGLDIVGISHIINMDFPVDPNEYVHRAGRTARVNHHGQCISIVNPTELAALRIYQRTFGIEVEGIHLVKGKILSGATKQFYTKTKEERENSTKKNRTKKTEPKKTVKSAAKKQSFSKGGQDNMDKDKQKELLDKVRKAKNPGFNTTPSGGKNTAGFKPGNAGGHSNSNKKIGNPKKGM